MDPLSNVLQVLRLDGTFFYPVDAYGVWSVNGNITPRIREHVLPGKHHLLPYHVVLEGHCFGGVKGETPVALEAGDVIVFPHGDEHVMSSHADRRIGTAVDAAIPPRFPETVVVGEGPAPTTRFLCGYFGVDLRPFNPLFASLPRRMHIRGMPASWIESLRLQLSDAGGPPRPGAESVLTRLAELMFIEVVRRYLDELPRENAGWLAGLRDDTVGRALALIHERPAHPWTLVDLAREAASSRTRLTERFSELIGLPPMQYLASWRMQVAAGQLRRGDMKVAAVARAVGYDSEAAFSRAFKKATGVSPGAWRQQDSAPPR